MKKWEYLSFTRDEHGMSDSEMNELGVQGWELVTHTVIFKQGIFGDAIMQAIIFKREVYE